MIGKLVGVLIAACLGTSAQQHVLLDFSGSMKGFAIGPNQRLNGMLQRLGHGLEASGSVRFHGFNSLGGRNAFTDLSLNDAASRFTNPNSYVGNSPLIASIGEAARRPGAAEIVVFTDGMEDDARLENVANALAQYAHDGWGFGIAAFMLPFDGNYYAEMRIPLDEFFPRIRESIRQADTSWVVKQTKCTTANASCYGFKGNRPMLVILLSRAGDLTKLFSVLDDAAAQLVLKPHGKLRVFPASNYTPTIRAELKAETRQALRPPKTLDVMNDVVKAEFSCLQSGSDPLALSLILSSSGASIDDATMLRPDSLRIVGQSPSWVSRTGSNLNIQPDGAARHNLTFVCRSPGLLDSIRSSSSLLPGSLHLEYTYKHTATTQGWWIDLSAENPWQSPHKVYRLKELVNRVQQLAIQSQSPRTLRVEISLKSTN